MERPLPFPFGVGVSGKKMDLALLFKDDFHFDLSFGVAARDRQPKRQRTVKCE
jgi:hypothetical protein